MEEEFKRFEFNYGLILIRTKRFGNVMDRLGSYRIAKPAGWFLTVLMPIAAAIGFYLFISALAALFSPRGVALGSYIRSLGPLANLGLPGINPYLPIVYGWIAVFVGIVVHEGAHGVVARSLGMPVKSSGLIFFLFLPLGAFVDVDEKVIKEVKASYSERVLASGAGINIVVGVLSLFLLVGVASTMTPASSQGVGVFVHKGSPINQAGVQNYDYILAVNGVPLNDLSSIGTSSWYRINNTVTLTVWRGGTTFNRTMTIGQQLFENTSSGQKFLFPYMGINLQGPASRSESDLQTLATTYAGSLTKPAIYVCLPTLPNCQELAPFSDTMSGFYTSSLGSAGVPLANLFYWIFFLNFNLAIFNALPIYPLDGGQAFRIGVKALGRGKLSERTVMAITGAATLFVIAILAGFIAFPYIQAIAG